jgi:hypothetical protein
MATEKKSNTLAQIGPVAAPLAGLAVAIVLIAVALLTSSVSDASDELATAVATTRKNLESSAVTDGGAGIPLAENVRNSFARTGTNDWKVDAGNSSLLALPVKWEVTMDTPIGDRFAQMDVNADGLIGSDEFSRELPPEWVGTLKAKFENWDRLNESGDNKPDGFIDRKEYADPPTSPEETFQAMQKPDPADEKNEVLTSKAGEISKDDEYKWDRYPFDGKIEFQEYADRYKPHDERGLGAVEAVEAKVDAASMAIVVTWSDPKIDDKPEDIAFMILRRAPETVAQREAAWRQEMVKFNKALEDWDKAFDTWYTSPSDADPAKTNKQAYPDKNKAKDEYAKKNPRLVAPDKPSEWENVTKDPVTGNEYRDSSFELGVTYTYAVYMGTKRFPKREQKVVTRAANPDWFFYAERQEATGHPVIVRNRIEMTWAGASPPNGTVELKTWYKLPDGSNTWYRVQISEILEPDAVVGKAYNMAALKDKKVKLFDTAGTELNALELLPKDAVVDFTTGFEFVTLGAKNVIILESAKLGDFELQSSVKGPVAAPDKPSANEAALEVRCLALKNGGKEATFELTRWVKVGQTWLRVELTTSAKTETAIGREVQIDKPGEGVAIYGAAGGAPLSAADLKAFKDAKVDMQAGTYDGFEGRTVTVDGQAFDLFGTLYKD